MKSLTVFVIFAIVCGAQGQSLDALCPAAKDDVMKCAQTFLREVSPSLSGMFGDTSKILTTVNFLGDSSFRAICAPTSRIAVKKFYRCFTGKLYSCLPDEWQQAFPASRSMEDSIDYLCDNIQDVDAKCLTDTSKLQRLGQCIGRTMSGKTAGLSSPEDFVELMCSVYPMLGSCMRTVYTTCQGRTADVLIEYSQYMRPQGCAGCMFRSSLLLLLISLVSTIVFRKL